MRAAARKAVGVCPTRALNALRNARSLSQPQKLAMAETAVRLLALPALLWLLLGWMNVEPPMVAGIAVILMAMPTAVNGSMLSMEYGGDTECMAQITFLTTLVSIITIPVVSALLL